MAKENTIEKKKPKATVKKYSGKISPQDVLTIVTDSTAPKRRPGSKVAAIFNTYKTGDTVADWLGKAKAVGGGLGNLRKDLAHGRIKLTPSNAKAA